MEGKTSDYGRTEITIFVSLYKWQVKQKDPHSSKEDNFSESFDWFADPNCKMETLEQMADLRGWPRCTVFPTLCNQIWPITLKIMAIMAKKFLKYGHNMATFSMDFDPIFSFYGIFMWQFLQKISNLKRNFSNFFWEKFPKCKSENSKMKIIGKICFLPQNFVNVKLKSEIWPKWPQN